ncbi:MAG: hypothetical protein ACFCU9_05405 [Cyanophyceae cyanobacterium]
MADNNLMARQTVGQMDSADSTQAELTDDELETVAGGWCGNELHPAFKVPIPRPVDPFRSVGIGLQLPSVHKSHF